MEDQRILLEELNWTYSLQHNYVCFPNSTERFTGEAIKISNDGQILQISKFKNGKPHGLLTEWHKNGNKKIETMDVNNTQNYTEWYESGKKEIECILKDGKLNGAQTEWYENGNKKIESYYKNGKLYSHSIWYKNGKKEIEANYKNEKVHGLFTSWYENGKKKNEANYFDGEIHGEMTTWFKNGKIDAIVQVRNGVIIKRLF